MMIARGVGVVGIEKKEGGERKGACCFYSRKRWAIHMHEQGGVKMTCL